MDALLEQLNPPQREAVTTTEGPLLVIAGAGSGKTRVITYRIAYLLRERGVRAGEVFAATFTNKAAREMRDRVLRLLGAERPHRLAINTFHSLCVNILRVHATHVGLSRNFLIADERDSLTCMRESLKELKIEKETLQPSQALWVVSQCKLRLLGPDAVGEVITSGIEDLYARAFESYQRRLRADDAVDFDDLIGYVVQLFERSPDVLGEYQDRFRYILVDEYQDTNASQFRLVSLLAGRHKNICVVGDEDQSIYSWRGADLGNLLEFRNQYPDAGLVKLEQNYRSTGNILTAAASVIARNSERIGKTLWSDAGDGLPLAMLVAGSETDEARQLCELIERVVRKTRYRHKDIALFYRLNSISRVYEDALRAYDIPYQVLGGTGFYDRLEIRDLVAYLQFVANPNANLALLRIANKPKRGVGDKTLAALMNDALRGSRSLFAQILAALDDGTLKGRARAELTLFAQQATEWMKLAAAEPPSHVLQRILDDTKYRDALGDPNSLDVRSRLENVVQLGDALVQYERESPDAGLSGWLESIALASAADDHTDDDRVSLMTLHTAKGLEYPVVIIAGMEDGIFPHKRSIEERGNVEEERRLFYVGVTRAEKLLVLSRAEMRVMHGELRFPGPSPLLFELPGEVVVPLVSIDVAMIDTLAAKGSRGRREALEAAAEGARSHQARADADAEGSTGSRDAADDGGRAALERSVAATIARFAPLTADEAVDAPHWEPDDDTQRAPVAPPRSTARPTIGPAARLAARRAEASGAPRDPLAWAGVGASVEHESFGRGLIVGVSGTGPLRKLLIEFVDEGRQYEMIAQYAKIRPAADAGEST